MGTMPLARALRIRPHTFALPVLRPLAANRSTADVAEALNDLEVGAAEAAIVARRLVPHRNMRRDLAVHQLCVPKIGFG